MAAMRTERVKSRHIVHPYRKEAVPELKGVTNIKGDMFTNAPHGIDVAWAHCVSADFHMNAGIARTWKHKFGGVAHLLEQKAGVGAVATMRETKTQTLLCYMVTKQKYWQKPTYESMETSLRTLALLCSQHKIRQLCVPRIGCGLDCLEWPRVLAALRTTIPSHITISVYTL